LSIQKQDWQDWKQEDITRAFYSACNERINDTKEILASSAGIDQTQDNFLRGFIAAYSEMLDFKVEDMEDD